MFLYSNKTNQSEKKYVPSDVYGRRAVELRQNLATRKDHKPESLMSALLPDYKKAFDPVLDKVQNVKYRGFDFDVQDYGDYIRFRPKGKNTKPPKRARIFFHGLQQSKMKSFPDFPTAKKDASFDKHYQGVLRIIDTQNALSGLEDNSIDIIWHRGFWGAPDDRNLAAHQYIDENVNPNFRRGFIDKSIFNLGKNDIEKQFGEGTFAPDIFVRSAAFTLEKLQQQYDNIDLISHSMGNATLLEALDILDNNKPDKPQKTAQFSALLTHPVPSTNHAAQGARIAMQRQRSHSELLEYTGDLIYKILGRENDPEREKGTPTLAKIFSLLDEAVENGKMTDVQRKSIIHGVRENNIAIVEGHYHLDPLNNVLQNAFPLLDKRMLRQYFTSTPKWQMPTLDNWLVANLTEESQENNTLSKMMALQPFCVGPFYDGKAEKLLDKKLGKGHWKVFAGGQDKLAPNPESFLKNIFDFKDQKSIVTLPRHAIRKEDLNKLQDKKIVIVQTGGHSTPVLQNNALHSLTTRMYQ